MLVRNGITQPFCSTSSGPSSRLLLKSLLFFILSGFLPGCGGTIDSELTHNKHPVDGKSLPEARYNIGARLIVSDDIESKTFNKIDIGSGLVHLLRDTLQKVFIKVDIVRNDEDSETGEYDLLLYPEFTGETEYFELTLTGKEPLTRATLFQVTTHGRSSFEERTMNPAMDVGAALRTFGLSTSVSIDDYKEAKSITRKKLEKSIIRTVLKLAHTISIHPSLSQIARVKDDGEFAGTLPKDSIQVGVAERTHNAPFANAPDKNIPVGKPAGRHDIALLIGNRNYQKEGVPRVDHALRDMDLVKTYLIKTMGFYPENIISHADATKGDFATLFGTPQNHRGKLHSWVKPGISRVFIYYTGHGIPELNGDELYFVPVDADLDYISQSGFSVSLFYKNLKKIPARETIVVLDTCFSGRTPKGTLFRNVSAIVPVPKSIPMLLANTAVLTSAHNNQVSTWHSKKGHSLFTYYFLMGLQGKADLNRDRTITTGEMQNFLIQEVPYMARRIANKEQVPKLEGRNDLVLAILEK